MEPIDAFKHILLQEKENEDKLYLYLEGDEWCAYERSAYYLATLKNSVKVVKEILQDGYDVILTKARFGMDELSLPLAPFTSLESVADDKLAFRLDHAIAGFGSWKQEVISQAPAC
ncbi:hypothetical protein [Parabacteroides pacaensis]|uniref:hypothetical protein n=1 Tax=Parabacteroides pacaensis TaxID=2086575 RepID=UPI000D0F5E3B|nr:hypothetical protein [Parabacteroides pacaensis]